MVALNLDDANIHELGDDDCHRRQKVAHLQAYHRWTHATNSGGSEKKMLIYTHYDRKRQWNWHMRIFNTAKT